MTYSELIYEVLKRTKASLNVKQIWQNAKELGYDKKLESIGKTPTQTIWNRLLTDIKSENPKFMYVTRKPTTFCLKTRQKEFNNFFPFENQNKTQNNEDYKKIKFKERDLHPLLVKFLYESSDFNLNCKTILHEKSNKSQNGKDKWNYPDIVGIYFPYDEIREETLELLNLINRNDCKLFSFELKIALNFSNLKESYFQAVSNSSWANEGYLVVFEELEDEVLSELRRLNQSFGIGLICLDSEISNSKILLSAKYKELDVQTLDLLVEKNSDFKQFITDINLQIKMGKKGKIIASFDKILNDEELKKHCKDKGILEN